MKKLFWILPAAVALAFAADDPKAEKEILAVMDTYKDAMIHNNAAVLEKLLRDDLTFVHSAGQLEHKSDVLKSVTTGKNVITKMEFSDSSVRIYGNTALVKCRVDLWHKRHQYRSHEYPARLGQGCRRLAVGGPPSDAAFAMIVRPVMARHYF
jgi:hypothetical protein